jgi:hypothetical protein
VDSAPFFSDAASQKRLWRGNYSELGQSSGANAAVLFWKIIINQILLLEKELSLILYKPFQINSIFGSFLVEIAAVITIYHIALISYLLCVYIGNTIYLKRMLMLPFQQIR